MAKGLPRSLANRGSEEAKQRALRVRQTFKINHTVTVSATGAAIGFGSVVVGDFPQGNILFEGALAYLTLAGSGADANLTDTWSGDFAFGTTPAGDATISAGDEDLVPETAVGPAVAEVSPRTRAVQADGSLFGVVFDNTDGSLEVNLNVLIDAANITDDESVDLTATGELYLVYTILGDD